MFPITTIDLGEVKQGSEHKLEYYYSSNINYIKKVTSPCVCTDVTNYAKEKKIVAKYKAGEIPIHLEVDRLARVFNIVVDYVNNDGTENQQYLEFKAVIIKQDDNSRL